MSVRFLDELTELEKLNLIPLSYSRMDTIRHSTFGCEAKYFYTYIAKEPRVSGEAAILGNVIHDVLENVLEPDIVVTQDMIDAFMDEYQSKLLYWDPASDIISPELISAGESIIHEFIDRHDGEKLPILSKEKHFSIVVGRALISGFIDRIDVIDDKVFVVDYKTGKAEVAAKNIHNNLQLGIYSLAMRKYFPDKEVHAQLYYLRSGRIKGHHFSDDDLLSVENTIMEFADRLSTIQNYNYTSNYTACKWCEHAASGACVMGVRRTS